MSGKGCFIRIGSASEPMPVRMITAPYFIACKLAAFAGRGNGDYLMSHDMEDIVAVMDGRPELVSEVGISTDVLR